MRLASNQKKFKLYSRSFSCETAGNQHLLHLFFTCDSELAASRRPRPGQARVMCQLLLHIHKSSLRGVFIFEPGVWLLAIQTDRPKHIQQTARLVNFYPKHSTFPFVSQDSESQMVNDFNSSDGLATEGLS